LRGGATVEVRAARPETRKKKKTEGWWGKFVGGMAKGEKGGDEGQAGGNRKNASRIDQGGKGGTWMFGKSKLGFH